MPHGRIVDLYSMLFRSSLLQERGLAVALGRGYVRLSRKGVPVGVWTCDGDDLVWTPADGSKCETYPTVTEAADRTMTGH